MTNYLQGPLGPYFAPQDPIWPYVYLFSFINICFPATWFVITYKKWRINRSDFVLRLQLVTLFLAASGQLCIIAMSFIWPTCKYPYVSVVPPTHHANCGATIAYRSSNIVFFICLAIFNMTFVHRFQPTYEALGLPHAKRVHIGVYCMVWSTSVIMCVAAISNLTRRNTEELELTDLTSAISIFEDFAPAASTGVMSSVNLGTTLMGITFIFRTLKEVKNELHKSGPSGNQSTYHLRLTFVFLVSNVVCMVLYGLCWLRSIPFLNAIPLVVVVNLRVFMCFLYMTSNFLALNTFIKAVAQQQKSSSYRVTSTWVQNDLGPKSDHSKASGQVNMYGQLNSVSTTATD
jgi:hypothetical protein